MAQISIEELYRGEGGGEKYAAHYLLFVFSHAISLHIVFVPVKMSFISSVDISSVGF